MNSKKAELIDELLKNYSEIFEKRPGMLGKTYEIYGMFALWDNIAFIQKNNKEMDSDFSWHSYLIEKKYIVGGNNKLDKILLDSPYDYTLLQSIRSDYKNWLKRKLQSKGS